MKVSELEDKLYFLEYTTRLNQRYHQARERMWAILERGTRMIVGFLAGLGVVTCFIGPEWASVLVAILALLAAIALNVLPFGDREKASGELFRRWTDLRTDIEQIQNSISGAPPNDDIPSHILERFGFAQSRRNAIEAAEPSPNEKWLLKAQQDENYSRWGKRDWEDCQKVIDERKKQSAPGSSECATA